MAAKQSLWARAWPSILMGLVALGGGVWGSFEWWEAREGRIRAEEMFSKLRMPHHTEDKGWWVGDITELYRLGQISREVAEADTAPLVPLVPRPIPFHGYFVRVMESGPPVGDDDVPTPLKGKKWSKEAFAICFYPAEPGSKNGAVITSSHALFRRVDPWPTPVFTFPTLEERRNHWAIVD